MSRQSEKDARGLLRGIKYGVLIEIGTGLAYFVALNIWRLL